LFLRRRYSSNSGPRQGERNAAGEDDGLIAYDRDGSGGAEYHFPVGSNTPCYVPLNPEVGVSLWFYSRTDKTVGLSGTLTVSAVDSDEVTFNNGEADGFVCSRGIIGIHRQRAVGDGRSYPALAALRSRETTPNQTTLQVPSSGSHGD